MTEIELPPSDYAHFVCTLFDKQGNAWNAYASCEDNYILVPSLGESPAYIGATDLFRFEYSGEFTVYRLDGMAIEFNEDEINRLGEVICAHRDRPSLKNDRDQTSERLCAELQELRKLHRKLELCCGQLRNRAPDARQKYAAPPPSARYRYFVSPPNDREF